MVIGSPSSTSAIGPPSWASGVTWPTMKPCEPPEKRPSVMQRDVVAEAGAHDGGGRREHLGHAGAALGAFVADDDDVALFDLACARGRASMSSSES